MFSSRIIRASIVPEHIPDGPDRIENARRVLAHDGAVVVGGLHAESDAIGFATELLGDRLVRVGRQFRADMTTSRREAGLVDAQPVDSRGRKRSFGSPEERMTAHNDGFAFGDHAPDHLFLWCSRPAMPSGGDSFLIDAAALVDLLRDEPRVPGLADFCWNTAIDHSEPNFPLPDPAPIARRTPSGRVQVRFHPYLASCPGAPPGHETMIGVWRAAVDHVRDNGPMFRAEAGEMLCIDNFRVLHGRDGYTDPDRAMSSIWAWTTDALAVPREALDIVAPDLAALHR
ncbi:hypothetical protein DW322_20285 [Rhodococcus rhodnii]|uniref:TauD/TfdA-like domain-containing protein n=2 Tax=Rhodococcus rhodnii TaxID=38312 RepID=R7WRT0_9NOCA|nr:TauD/TfdA family dioxygenase [Rhodococcus rhodnii]EOM78023.1 hypothetical protein Rrhod_0697 [Rhodococcus rhodnii LMG 5362]TXG92080.1 hypothetical protein DW322_20285 [Rhodococcus rhodnii]